MKKKIQNTKVINLKNRETYQKHSRDMKIYKNMQKRTKKKEKYEQKLNLIYFLTQFFHFGAVFNLLIHFSYS